MTGAPLNRVKWNHTCSIAVVLTLKQCFKGRYRYNKLEVCINILYKVNVDLLYSVEEYPQQQSGHSHWP